MKSGSKIVRLVSEFECNFQGPGRKKELGNPFSDDSGTLSTLNTKIKSKNVKMLTTYKLRFRNKTKKSDTKASYSVLHPPRNIAKIRKHDLAALKSKSALFSRTYISCQYRAGDFEAVFRHGNLPYPPSLIHGRNL